MLAYSLEFIVILLGIVLLLVEAFAPRIPKQVFGLLGAIGLGVVLALVPGTSGAEPSCSGSWLFGSLNVGDFFSVSQTATFFKAFILVATILGLLLSVDYRAMISRLSTGDRDGQGSGEFYILPLFACAGMMWMSSATNFVSLFVSLELTTITFYVLVGYFRRNVGSLEAGVKYLVLGALSTGFLVYGIAWIYGMTGTFGFEQLSQVALGRITDDTVLSLMFGFALVLVALGFKVGAAPMQMWIPDVYQGAPMPVTAMLSVASKAAGFAVMINLFRPLYDIAQPLVQDVEGGKILAINGTSYLVARLTPVLFTLAMLTLLVGNLAAIVQSNVKRLLAYSSIAHAGFIMVLLAFFQPGDALANARLVDGILFYLLTYLIMTMGAFYALSVIRAQRGAEDLGAFYGLAKTNPRFAAAVTILFAGLAGLPLTAGFVGKFIVFSEVCGTMNGASGLASGWALLAVLSVCAITGFYYYFKVIRAMYMDKPQDSTSAVPVRVPLLTSAILALLVLLTILVGVMPYQVFEGIKGAL